MTRKLINLRLPPDLVVRVDAEAARLGQTRTKFIERALEAALSPSVDDLYALTPARPAKAPKTEIALEVREAVRAHRAPDLQRGADMHAAAMKRQAKLNAARDKK